MNDLGGQVQNDEDIDGLDIIEDQGGAPAGIKPWDPKLIRINTKSFTLREVVDQIQDEDIDLSPDFQREFVWKARQRTRLVESILLGIPLPAFYFNQSESGSYQVVDGVQRLSTISLFMRDGFRLSSDDLEYLSDLNGLAYSELDPALVRRFRSTQIIVHIIEPQTPDEVKYDIFNRVNTLGSPLSPQEIRHAMSGQLSRSFIANLAEDEAFDRATENHYWRRAPDGSWVRDSARMANRELALRFCAFRASTIEEYRQYPSLDAFLMDFTKRIDGVSQRPALDGPALGRLAHDFRAAMNAAAEIFGAGGISAVAFRRRAARPDQPSCVRGAGKCACGPPFRTPHGAARSRRDSLSGRVLAARLPSLRDREHRRPQPGRLSPRADTGHSGAGTVMIARADIRGFKRFTSAQFRLGALTVLAELNGSGKTSLIQALLLAQEASNSGSRTLRLNGPFGLELGTAEDVLNWDSRSPIGISLEGLGGHRSEWVLGVPSEEALYLNVVDKPSDPPKPFSGAPRTFTYLSAERLGPRGFAQTSPLPDAELEVGRRGEYCAHVLGVLGDAVIQHVERAHPLYEAPTTRLLKYEVEQWLGEIARPVEVSGERLPGATVAELRFRSPGATWVRSTNMGFGVTYALPIILGGLIAEPGGLVIVENPEAHLHPAGQSRIGVFLAWLAGRGVQTIIETHSDHVLNGIRRAIAEHQYLDPTSAFVHWFGGREGDGEAEQPSTLVIGEGGSLSDWPLGFFDQYQLDVASLGRARRSRR